MSRKILYYIAVLAVAIAFMAQPNGIVYAASCSGPSCNGVNPFGTTCWNDKQIVGSQTTYTSPSGGSGKMRNYNYYSPGCAANFSYTTNFNVPKVARWLMAQSSPGVTYWNDNTTGGKKVFVYNLMSDGTGVVCTKGAQGNTSPNVFDVYSNWVCV
jgi:hypothetical protein